MWCSKNRRFASRLWWSGSLQLLYLCTVESHQCAFLNIPNTHTHTQTAFRWGVFPAKSPPDSLIHPQVINRAGLMYQRSGWQGGLGCFTSRWRVKHTSLDPHAWPLNGCLSLHKSTLSLHGHTASMLSVPFNCATSIFLSSSPLYFLVSVCARHVSPLTHSV